MKHGDRIESTSIRSTSEKGTFDDVATLLPTGEPISGVACRGARAMLGVSQWELCKKAECGRSLLNDFENNVREPRIGSAVRIRIALEDLGAIFLRFRGVICVSAAPDKESKRTPRALTMGFD